MTIRKPLGGTNACGSSKLRCVGKISFIENSRNLFLYRSVWTVDLSPSVLCRIQLLIKAHCNMQLMP